MVNVTARIKVKGKDFEILVDVENAIKIKEGKPVSIQNTLAIDKIFYDVKKATRASEADLQTAFGTTDAYVIAEKIIRQGDVQIPSEFKNQEREAKMKQVVDWLSKNALNPATNKPHTPDRIKSALQMAGVNVDNRPVTEQMGKIIEKLRPIMPIRIETKKLSVRIPVLHTGKAYGLFQEYKEKEEWLANGDLLVIMNIPAGMQMDFYDKLNGITHGSAIVEEIKEK